MTTLEMKHQTALCVCQHGELLCLSTKQGTSFKELSWLEFPKVGSFFSGSPSRQSN